MINDPFFQSTSDYYLELAHVLINSLSVDKKLNLFIRETVIHSTKQLDYINTDSCIIFVPVELEQKDEVLPKLIVVFEVVGDNCCTHLVTTAKNNHEHFITTELLPNAKIKNYNLHELYSDSNIRRTLNKAKYYSHDKRLHNIYCKQYALALTTKLYKIPVGKGISPNNEDSDEKEYQKTIGDILDLFFDECDAEREIEKRVSNNSFRFDLTYYIPPFSDILWDQIREHSKSSHILIECKNSKEDGELIKAVSQVQKYFSSTTVG
ncbi:hypothetical protein, partial [Aeromonas hydrophila]